MFYDIKEKAKARLQEDYTNQLLVLVLYLIIIAAATGTVIGNILVGGPLTLGFTSFYLKSARKEKTEINDLFNGLNNFVNALIAYIVKYVFVFLWSLLFVIPGIIKLIAYSQAFYLMNDDPSLSGTDALSKSERMMQGHKMEYFMFVLSFIGWWILSIITGGLVYVLYFGEYYQTAKAEFYLDLRSRTKL